MLEILWRSAAAFFALLFFTRILGKKQMNQITYFDYITGITLGSIAAEVSIRHDVSVVGVLISFAVWAGLTFIVAIISLKSYKARTFFDGQPDILISRGRILHKAVKKAHLNMDDVIMLLREKDVFSVSEVDYAILEPHGKLSVLKKPEMNNVTLRDMHIVPKGGQLPTDIIIDGRVIKRNLSEAGKDDTWLMGELMAHGLMTSDVRKIFYMAIEQDGSVYISMK